MAKAVIAAVVLAHFCTAVLAQTPDGFQSNSAPPSSVIAGPRQWDGIWAGRYDCAADQTHEAFGWEVVIEVKDGAIARRVDAPARAPGEIGYERWSGSIADDGNTSIYLDGVSEGGPGGRLPRGTAFHARVEGRFLGGSFIGRNVTRLPRDCRVQLTRK